MRVWTVTNGTRILGILLMIPYLLGALFPDLWWTTHFLAFLPSAFQYAFLIIGMGILIISMFLAEGVKIPGSITAYSPRRKSWIILIIALLIALLMYQFPIASDYYGDAYKIIDRMDQVVPIIPSGTREALLKYGLSPWDGHTTVLAIVTYLAYFFEISYGQAFLLLDTICGFFFVLSWLYFIRYYFSSIEWKLVYGLAGITAPFMLIFFGHTESYAVSFLFMLLWMLALLVYTKEEKELWLWILIFLFLISVKFHPVSLLFTPALLIVFIHHYKDTATRFVKVLNWKGAFRWILVPIFGMGMVLYFFVFQDHQDTRDLNEKAMEFDRLFLPILSPDPPLHKYNLLSWNHIFDYIMSMFLWSPVVLFILLSIFSFYRKSIQWNTLAVLTAGITFILFFSLFFVINPLLSMPMDWDLISIPAISFILFTVALSKQVEHADLVNRSLLISLMLVVFSIPNFILHTKPSAVSKRLESLSIRIYHTYYEWSSKVLEYALSSVIHDRESYEIRKQRVLNDLRPYALQTVDFEYARMLVEEGRYYLRTKNDPNRALEYLDQAYFHFPRERNGLLYLMEAHFLLNEFDRAFDYSQGLVREQYPSEKKAISIAIQCALEAELYTEALNLSGYYIEQWNDRQVISEVFNGLQNNSAFDSLKFLFQRPEE